MTLSAGNETRVLVGSLARAGWGELSGREWQGVRSVLRALVDLLPYGSGEGLVTASQVAEAAGLSSRWVRRCMCVLEDAGVIAWHRGGVVAGRPQPSAVRVSKRAMVALVEAARPLREARDTVRRAATLARLRALRTGYVRSRPGYRRRSSHAELSATLRPLRGGTGAPPGAPARTAPPPDAVVPCLPPEWVRAAMAKPTAAARMDAMRAHARDVELVGAAVGPLP